MCPSRQCLALPRRHSLTLVTGQTGQTAVLLDKSGRRHRLTAQMIKARSHIYHLACWCELTLW